MIPEINRQLFCKLKAEKEKIAEKVLNLQYERYPEYKKEHAVIGYHHYRQGMGYCLSQLAEAVNQDEVLLFSSYAAWAKVVLDSPGRDSKGLTANLECIRAVFGLYFSNEEYQVLCPFVETALEQLKINDGDIPACITKENPCSELALRYLELALEGEKQKAVDLILDAANNRVGIKSLYLDVFACTQHEVGRLWQLGKISVAQEHYCTALTQLIIAQLYPAVFSQRNNASGHRFIGTCISNELHEMGIRMVADFLEQDGWDTHYLGADMPEGELLKAIGKVRPDIIGVSVTMTGNLSRAEHLIHKIRNDFANDKIKIIVGGYPFNLSANLWRKLGADGCSGNAAEAVILCNRLIEG